MLGQGFALGEQALGTFDLTSLTASTSLASSAQIIADTFVSTGARVTFVSQSSLIAALEFKNKLNMRSDWQPAANILAAANYRLRITAQTPLGAGMLATMQSLATLQNRTASLSLSASLISAASVFTSIGSRLGTGSASFVGNAAILRASRARQRAGNVVGVVSTEVPWLSLVVREDTSWARLKYDEIEYEFSGRNFRANPYNRGAYNTNSNGTTIFDDDE